MTRGLARVLAETRASVAADPRIAAFIGGALDAELPYRAAEPATLPAVAALPRCRGLAAPATAALTEAVIAAAPELCWRQSYTDDEVGAHFLANYGWFNLVSPDGPYRSEACRVSVGYWGAGLDYPDHRHDPEEIYLVLAGSARFRRAGSPPRPVGPGGTYHNPAGVMHGTAMTPGPLLAMAFWKGERLTAKPDLPRGAAQTEKHG